MKRRDFLRAASASATVLAAPNLATARQVFDLKVHSFLPAATVTMSDVMRPLAKELAAKTDGGLNLQIHPSMELGGSPASLMDQAKSGISDIVLGMPLYTPGQYPRTEVFELPFMMKDPMVTSQAFHAFVDEDLAHEEFSDVKMLGSWVHGPSVLHSVKPINSLEDVAGLKISCETGLHGLMKKLGAEPVSIPLQQINFALADNIIDAVALPWEIMPSLKIEGVAEYHLEFASKTALHTSTLVLAMNSARYEGLPDELKAVFDETLGADLSLKTAGLLHDHDIAVRDSFEAKGHNITRTNDEETLRWQLATQSIYGTWMTEMDARGLDGEDVLNRALSLTAKYAPLPV